MGAIPTFSMDNDEENSTIRKQRLKSIRLHIEVQLYRAGNQD